MDVQRINYEIAYLFLNHIVNINTSTLTEIDGFNALMILIRI
jgi:hypothetical protein